MVRWWQETEGNGGAHFWLPPAKHGGSSFRQSCLTCRASMSKPWCWKNPAQMPYLCTALRAVGACGGVAAQQRQGWRRVAAAARRRRHWATQR